MPEYEIAVDLDRCDGIFACLVRDGRFAESEEGLVTLPGAVDDSGVRSARFDDDRRDDAEAAAAACPTDAIEVREVQES